MKTTGFTDIHIQLGAKMSPFAGYNMPISYSSITDEHKCVRESVGMFDVSHMGQLRLKGANAAAALEALVPVDIIDLPAGQQRYAFFTNEQGGIMDDLMVSMGMTTVWAMIPLSNAQKVCNMGPSSLPDSFLSVS